MVLFILLVASTYLPVLFGLDLIIGVGLSSLILLASTPFWTRILRGRGEKSIGLRLIVGVYVFFMIVRVIEVLVFWDQLLYMAEKAWGLMLLVLILYYYGVSGENYGFLFKPALNGLVDYLFTFIIVGASLLALLVSIPAFTDIPSMLSLPLVYGIVFSMIIVLYLIVNSLFEEFLFRGLLYTTLSAALGLVVGGFLTQSLLFGLWHLPHHILYFNPYRFLFHTGFAVVFGLVASVYRRLHKSLTIPVIIHTVVNLLSFASASPQYPVIVVSGYVLGVQEVYFTAIIVLTIIYALIKILINRKKN